jgi:hypothetical protein
MNKNTVIITAVVIFGAVLWMLGSSETNSPEKKYMDFPWVVTFPTDSTMKVLGITLGQDNVSDARIIFNTDFEMGLYVKKDKTPSLEVYFNSVKQAGLSAKVIAVIDIKNQPWEQWQVNHVKGKGLPEGEVKYSLNVEDYRVAEHLPIKMLVYIPAANLDDDVINQRFGQEHEDIKISKTIKYWIYKDKGIAVRMDSEGKEMFRYTHPSNLSAVRQSIQAELDEELAEQEKARTE